ncbi:MAG: mycothiol conjugate amidase Mca [Actinobacteria bacterium]|nr:mycothiol conjugate amidase Mca [Actinomycetota bacterium]
MVSASSAGLRLMAVHAHPDDESSKGAASAARYISEGAQVMVVTCTGGERGDVLNASVVDEVDRDGIHAVRQREMAQAAALLGVSHAWLGFEDSGLPEEDPDTGITPALPDNCFALVDLDEATEPLVRLIREFRPQVLTTYDEHGGYPHPDHIRTHEVSMAAVEAAADATLFPDSGDPWTVSKVYYHMTFHKARVMALHEALEGADMESPYGDWLANWTDRPHDAERLTTLVPCAEWFGVREEALRAHRTQVDPEGPWFRVPLIMQQRVWPTEDFQLATSSVETSLPEDDLFAGLRSEGAS